jgi:hypothetical protein
MTITQCPARPFATAIRPLSVTLAAFNGARWQVACEIGQQRVRDN